MKQLFCIISMLFVLHVANGQDSPKPITTAIPLLNTAPDARSGGMGDAGVASSPDIVSQHWNVSKYAFIDGKYGASISYTPWLRELVNDVSIAYLSGFYKLDDRQAFSASFWYNSLGSVNRRDDQGYDLGEIKSNQFAFDLGYSMKIAQNWSLGVAFRYINSNIMGSSQDVKPVNAFAVDLGAYHQRDITLWGLSSQYAFGLNLSNIGTKVSYSESGSGDTYFLPMNMKLGGRFTTDIDVKNRVSFLTDFNKLMVPTPDGNDGHYDKSVLSAMFSSFGDAPGGFSEEMKEITYSVGAEYTFKRIASLRAGYYGENQDKGNRKYVTFGGGVTYSNFCFDVSYLISTNGTSNLTGNIFRFSLGIIIGKSAR